MSEDLEGLRQWLNEKPGRWHLISLPYLVDSARRVRAAEGARRERRRLEALDRRLWAEQFGRRLGLVTEVHRCAVGRSSSGLSWGWACQRPACGVIGLYLPSWEDALAGAFAHASAFLPQPPQEALVTDLDFAVVAGLEQAIRAEEAAFRATLHKSLESFREQVNERFAGRLPYGVRFEWAP